MWFSSWLRNPKRTDPGQRRRPHGSPCQRATFRPWLEALEARCLPSTLTVSSTADSGPGSLRAAIAAASNGDTTVCSFPTWIGHASNSLGRFDENFMRI